MLVLRAKKEVRQKPQRSDAGALFPHTGTCIAHGSPVASEQRLVVKAVGVVSAMLWRLSGCECCWGVSAVGV